MPRIDCNINDILNEIPESVCGVGEDLSLTSVYDDIKNAKYEDATDLSFGVWERELKKAEWDIVEKISFEALRDKTKDLQIACWLAESFVALEGFAGISRGLKVLTLFLENFWTSCYPKNDDQSSDEEYKLRILDWVADVFFKKTLLISFFPKDSEIINIYHYDYALDFLTRSKKSNSDENLDNYKTLEYIQNAIQKSNFNHIESIFHDIKEIKSAQKQFEETMNKIYPNDSKNIFKSLLNTILKIEKLLQTNAPVASIAAATEAVSAIETLETVDAVEDAGQQATPTEISHFPTKILEPLPAESINTKDEIYKHLNILAGNLKSIDSQGPSYYMLMMVISWKDKNLMEIIDDFQSGNSEHHKMLKILQKQ